MKIFNQLSMFTNAFVSRRRIQLLALFLLLIGLFAMVKPLEAQTIAVPTGFWSIQGNSGTTSDLNFLGTKDASDLLFKTNNTEWLRILKNGNIGIGMTNPKYKLDITGKLRLTDTLFGAKAKFSGLATGETSDNVVTIDNSGNLRKRDLGNLSVYNEKNANVSIGTLVLSKNNTGRGNIGIGFEALRDAAESTFGNTVIGNAAGRYISGSNNTFLGFDAGDLQSGERNIMIGANTYNKSSRLNNQLNIGNWIYGDDGKIGIGTFDPAYKLDVSGKIRLTDTLFGTKAKFSGLATGEASDNVITIDNAGNLHKRDANSTSKVTINQGNIAIGTLAMNKLTDMNKAYGTTYNYNLDNNIGIGNNTLLDMTSGTNNIAIGSNVLSKMNASTGNTIVGYDSGGQVTGSNNTFLGVFTGYGITGGSNIMIGEHSTAKSSRQNNQLNIGNWIYGDDGKIGIGTFDPAYKLDVSGKIRLTDTLIGAKVKFISLATAAATDSVVTIDNAGNLHKRDAKAFAGSNGIWKEAANNTRAKGVQFDGNVGIGTANPLYKLDIVGKAKLTDTLFGTKAKFSALATGEAADNLVTIDNAGNLRKLSASTLNNSNWSLSSSKQLYTDFPLALGTSKNGSHANAVQPGTILTVNGRTHIGKADGSDVSWVNYEQSTNVKDFLLYVQKGIITEDIGIATAGNSDWTWSDFVFEKDYRLRPLSEVEKYVVTNKHLPEIPSAADVAKRGYSLNKINALFLQKIEELTLYSIQQDKSAKAQDEKIKQLEEKVTLLLQKMGSADLK